MKTASKNQMQLMIVPKSTWDPRQWMIKTKSLNHDKNQDAK